MSAVQPGLVSEDVKASDTMVENVDYKEGDVTEKEYMRELQEGQVVALESHNQNLYEAFRHNPRIVGVLAVALLGILVAGLDNVVVNVLVGSQSFCKVMGGGYMSKGAYAVTPKIQTIWSALLQPAMLPGAFLMGPVADRIGRRWVIRIDLCLTILYILVAILAPNWKAFSFVQFTAGFVGGITSSIGPLFIAEIAPREMRAAMTAVMLFGSAVGSFMIVMIAYAAEKAFPDPDNKWGYRLPLVVCVILPAIVLVLQVFFLCESPVWLLMKDKREECIKTIKYMHPRKTDEERELVLAEYEYTLAKLNEHREFAKEGSYIDLFRPQNLRRTICSFLPLVAGSMSGFAMVSNQRTYFFKVAGETDSILSTAISSVLGFGGIFAMFFLSNNKYVGRRRLMLFSQVLMIIVMMGIGVAGTVYPQPYGKAAGKWMMGFICIGVFSIHSGTVGIGWSYAAESGATKLRAKTTAAATVINACTNVPYMIALATMLEANNLNINGTSFYFGAWGVIWLVILYFFLPDYTGRSFAQLDELFARKIPARQFRTFDCTGDYGLDVLHEN